MEVGTLRTQKGKQEVRNNISRMKKEGILYGAILFKDDSILLYKKNEWQSFDRDRHCSYIKDIFT